MTKPKPIHITLNPNGVAAPAQRIVIVASQVVSAALKAFAKDDLSEPNLLSGIMGYRFGGIEWSDEERRSTFQNWILSKGFQDLARGVRETLEEAIFYIEMLKLQPGRTTWGELEAKMAAIRSDAGKLQFPQLMEAVNKELKDKMAFTDEFISLQKDRNCLEHRGGLVGSRDVDVENGKMILAFPRVRLFYMRGEVEIEVAAGEAIDTHDVSDPSAEKGEVPIYFQRVMRTREYDMGEPVVITEADFADIAMACHMFAGDVASKLPTLPAIDTSIEDPFAG